MQHHPTVRIHAIQHASPPTKPACAFVCALPEGTSIRSLKHQLRAEHPEIARFA